MTNAPTTIEEEDVRANIFVSDIIIAAALTDDVRRTDDDDDDDDL